MYCEQLFLPRDEIREKGDKNDIYNGYDLRMDVVDPSSEDIFYIQKGFGQDVDTLKVVEHEAKGPRFAYLKTIRLLYYLTLNTKPFKI